MDNKLPDLEFGNKDHIQWLKLHFKYTKLKKYLDQHPHSEKTIDDMGCLKRRMESLI